MSNAVALVFPGQGSQSMGMLSELAVDFPQVRDCFAEASEGAGVDLWALSQEGPEAQLNQTEFTQPALLAAGVAVWRVWQASNGPPALALAGHSLGEYAALVAAGALSLADGAALVRERGRLMQQAVSAGVGSMAAVLGADDAVVELVCAKVSTDASVVVPANYNSPGQIVIGGHAAAVDAAIAELAAQGVRKAVKLAVSVPSHTPLMRDAAEHLAEAISNKSWVVPTIPVVQNVNARVEADLDAIRHALVRQLFLPVQWTRCVQALAGLGVARVAECGPGKVLSGLNKRIDKQLDVRALALPADLTAAVAEWS